MKNILSYKGYHAKIEFDTESMVLYGKIDGIKDLVNFESDSPQNIEKEFQDAVDDYLEFCNEVGKEPDKEYKGTFNVRIDPELHRNLAFFAYENDESLNAVVEKAIRAYVNGNSRTNVQLQQSIMILAKKLETQRVYSNVEPSIDVESKIIPFKMGNIKMSYQEEMTN